MQRTLLPLLVVLALLGACSSDDSGDSAPSTTEAATSAPETTTADTTEATTTEAATITEEPATTEAATEAPVLEDAVRAYTEAFLGGDVDGSRALLTQRCRDATAVTEWEQVVTSAAALYGDETVTSYDEEVDGQIGTATYELTDPLLNQTSERWVLEGGAWANDDCPA